MRIPAWSLLLALSLSRRAAGSAQTEATQAHLRALREGGRDPVIRVIGVNPPIYWEALHTREDYDLLQNTLLGRDRAFAENGSKPVALPLAGNAFGRPRYEGNSMLDAGPGQTMADAYDALVFLAPLEELHESPTMAFFYTPEFKTELRRRIQLLRGAHLAGFLSDEGETSLDQLIEALAVPQPAKKNALVEAAR